MAEGPATATVTAGGKYVQFRELLTVLVSRWRIIASVLLLCLGAAAVATLFTEPVYTATARIYLSAERDSSSEPGQASGIYVLTSEDLDTYVSILDTPAVMDPIREDLGLTGVPVSVSASTTGNTSILDVTATSSEASVAADVANAVGPQLGEVAAEFSTLLASTGQRVVSTPIQPAVAPSRPTSPDPVRNVLLALLAGMALGVGLALIRQAMDTKVRSEEDIRALSDAPLLASLPIEKGGKRGVVSLEDDPHGQHAEAIRRLRTNLLFVDITTGKHSFVVTSAVPGEGKTTAAVNLALALADGGTRTLLVDADLRNPSVHRTLGLEGHAGLTTVLLKQASLDEVLQPWGDTLLDVLAAGQIPPNPSELLGSQPMADLFDELLERYDFVIVDSSPVVPVIDAVIVERLTGGLLMVVAADRTKKRELAAALKQLSTVGATVSGFARNLVNVSKSGEYGYGYYRYRDPATPRRGRRSTASQEKPSSRRRQKARR